jgi:hypothetical protein
MMAVGSTMTMTSPYLVETVDDDCSDTETMGGESEEEFDEDAFMHDLYQQATVRAIDLDDMMASATHAKRSQGVDAKHLSKVWGITVEEANRTLNITTQDKVHTDNPNQEGWQVYSWSYLLSTVCNGQGIHICGSHEVKT